ncbi:hypothetical protein ACTG16_23465 [Aeromonas sp. 23P]|uniref:hypothetical protein n=1 Tax=Aeromonas sp. 23P TaxID=3452716 RepID=UPI003F7A441C
MISTLTPVCIDADSLKNWFSAALKNHGIDKKAFIIPQSWDAKGESRFFCSIDVDEPISVSELIKREVAEHSRGPYIHFYAEDVVAAACGAGELTGDLFWLYYTW